jgi:hypothetical protein
VQVHVVLAKAGTKYWRGLFSGSLEARELHLLREAVEAGVHTLMPTAKTAALRFASADAEGSQPCTAHLQRRVARDQPSTVLMSLLL